MNKHARHAVGESHVGAGLQLQMHVGRSRKANVARVHHDKLRAARNRLANSHANNRVRLFGVGAHKHNDVGIFGNIGNGVGHSARTQRLRKASNRGAVAHAGAVVDIVGFERRARHLLQHVDVFVGRARTRERSKRLPAELVANGTHTTCHQRQCLVPRGRFKLASFCIANKRRGKPIGRLHKIEAAASAFHAQQALVRGAVHRFGVNDFAIFHHQVILAAGGAMRARGKHLGGFPFAIVLAALLYKRARGARLGAVAAALALGCFPIGAERRLDGGANATLARAQRMVACRRVASAHATLARDTQVRVKREERIAVEHGGVFDRRLKRKLFHAELATEVLQLTRAILLTAEAEIRRVQAVARQNKVEREATRSIELIGGHRDLHTFLGKRRTRGQKALHAFDFDHAHAARGDVAHVLQEAQRGNVDVRRAGRVQNG